MVASSALSEPRGPSITVFRPIVYALTQLGLEWRTVLESCGIDPELLDDPDARVRKDEFDAFWPRAADLTGDSCFGLHLGQHFRPMAVNVLGARGQKASNSCFQLGERVDDRSKDRDGRSAGLAQRARRYQLRPSIYNSRSGVSSICAFW